LWCRFKHPRVSFAAHATWREQSKAYIIARPLDPGRLTESHADSIISFARSLSLVKERIELIKGEHHADDVWELIRHLKILVKDSAKKLQTSTECQRAEGEGCGDIAEPPVRVIHPYSVTPALTGGASGSCRLGLPIFAVSSENSYCSSNGRASRPASITRQSLVSKRLVPQNRMGVLATPNIRNLLRVVRGQDIEEEINSLRYLIGATGEGTTRLRQDPQDPLPLRQIIFLNQDNDMRGWLLANNGYDPLDLLVLESRSEDGDELDETPEPHNGGYPFLTATLGMNRPV